MAERAEAQQHRALVVVPVLDHRARVGEQCVVGMHDAFRGAGRPRGERQIDDLVGVWVDRRQRAGSWRLPGKTRQRRASAGPIAERVDLAQARQSGAAAKISAVARRRHSRAARTGPRPGSGSAARRSRRPCSSGAATGCRHSPGASRRGTRRPPRPGSAATPPPARRASARPHRDRRRPHRPSPQRRPGQPPRAVAQRESLGPRRRVPLQQRVQRLVAPHPLGVIAPRRRRVVQGQERVGHRIEILVLVTGWGLAFALRWRNQVRAAVSVRVRIIWMTARRRRSAHVVDLPGRGPWVWSCTSGSAMKADGQARFRGASGMRWRTRACRSSTASCAFRIPRPLRRLWPYTGYNGQNQ